MVKKIIFGLILLLIVAMLPFTATAQDVVETEDDTSDELIISPEEEIDLPDPGVTPDSALWGIDVALDKISLALTRNPEKKAAKGLEIAQERLAEMKQMAEEKKVAETEKAKLKHQEAIDKVDEETEKIEDEEKLTGIEQGMANHIAAMQKVQAKIQANENIPEETKTKLIAKFDNQIADAEELQTKIQSKQAETSEIEEEEAEVEDETETEEVEEETE